MTSSTLESPESLFEKYSNAEANVYFFENFHPTNFSRNNFQERKEEKEEEEGRGKKLTDKKKTSDSIVNDEKRGNGEAVNKVYKERTNQKHKVLYNIDATKLHEKTFFANYFDVIIFNFPFGDAAESTQLLRNDKENRGDNNNNVKKDKGKLGGMSISLSIISPVYWVLRAEYKIFMYQRVVYFLHFEF